MNQELANTGCRVETRWLLICCLAAISLGAAVLLDGRTGIGFLVQLTAALSCFFTLKRWRDSLRVLEAFRHSWLARHLGECALGVMVFIMLAMFVWAGSALVPS